MTLIIEKPTGAKLNLVKTFTWNETIWNPSMITTALWLDAADASTVTFSSGVTVSNWASKSGGYVLTQSDNAKRPARSGTVNGLATVVFDGGDGMSVVNFNLSSAGQQASFFAVFTASSGGDQFILEHTSDTNTNSGAFNVSRTSANQVGLTRQASNQYATFETSGTLTTSPKVYVGTMDGTLSTNENTGFLDGDGSGARFSNQNTNANFLNAALFLGSRNNASLFLNGQICEVGIIPSLLSTLNRQKIEGYLAHKWGLTANLPSDHPYKTVGPTP